MNPSSFIIASFVTLVVGFGIGRSLPRTPSSFHSPIKAVDQAENLTASTHLTGRFGDDLISQSVVEDRPVSTEAKEVDARLIKRQTMYKQKAEFEVRRVTRKLTLEDEQAAELADKFARIAEARETRVQETLRSEEELLAGVLTPEQMQVRKQKEADRETQRLEIALVFLDRRLKLSETQKDQIFMLMARAKAPHLEVEVPNGRTAAPSDSSGEESFRNLLTPEQRTAFDKDLSLQTYVKHYLVKSDSPQ